MFIATISNLKVPFPCVIGWRKQKLIFSIFFFSYPFRNVEWREIPKELIWIMNSSQFI